jgi:glycosyltransferase 2 family protein
VVVMIAFWGGVSRAWTGARTWLRRLPKGEWWERSLDSCRQFGREPRFVSRTLGLSMVLNAICVLQVLVLSWGQSLPISPVALFVIVPIIICISAIPITPNGLGVRENLFVFMLTDPTIGVPATTALSLSLLAYAGSLCWSVIGGVVYMTFKERHHLKGVELERADA